MILTSPRVTAISLAFEKTLQEFVIEFDGADFRDELEGLATFAIKLNELHCGPTAQRVAAHLQSTGIENIKFHSLLGHYVVKDEETGLLHDLEAYAGVASPANLPLAQRTVVGETVSESTVQAWLQQRTLALTLN